MNFMIMQTTLKNSIHTKILSCIKSGIESDMSKPFLHRFKSIYIS